MSFGVQFQNNQNLVILDSEFSRLNVISKGELQQNFTNYFERPATTQEPPLIFVKFYDPGTGVYANGGGCSPLGEPGNWTGFFFRPTFGQTPTFAPGKWFACQFGAQAVASYGMRLWDQTGKMLFDSGTPTALFTHSFQNWTYVTSTLGDTGAYTNFYTVPYDFSSDEYMLINNFGMKLIAGELNGRTVGTRWDFAANKLWAITVAFNNPYDFHLPALFAKLTV